MLSRIRMRDRIGTAIAFAAVAALLSGCGGGSSTESSSGATAKPGGTLSIGMSVDPETLTPAEALSGQAIDIISQINETLFVAAEGGKLEPYLATKMTTSPDGRTSTITLRHGVKFSDGRPMTSKDVAFSIDAARTSLYYSSLYEQITNVSAPTPTTVVVKTKEPAPAMKALLSYVVSAVVPDNYGGMTAKEFSAHPIGTGPFKFKSWSHGRSVTMTKNTNYWQPDEPLLDEVEFAILPEDNSRTAQLRGGQINALQQPPFPQLKGLEQEGFKNSQSPFSEVMTMALNQKEGLFSDPRIREAVNMAIDRQGIVNTAFSGEAEAAGSFLPPTLPGYDSSIKPPTPDIEKAKALVESAVSEGINPNFKLVIASGYAFYSSAAQIIQQDLKEIGLNPTLEPLESGAAFALMEEGKVESELTSYYSAVLDPVELSGYVPEYLLKPLGANVQKIQSLARRAAAELQPAKRTELYGEIQSTIASENSLIVLTYNPSVWMTAANVAGFDQSATSIPNLQKVGFSG